jgi:hypothetical protein
MKVEPPQAAAVVATGTNGTRNNYYLNNIKDNFIVNESRNSDLYYSLGDPIVFVLSQEGHCNIRGIRDCCWGDIDF